MKNYNPIGCFAITAKAIEECFKEPNRNMLPSTIIKDKKRRTAFAESNLLKVWCDCSHNFEYLKLRDLIINKNK